MFRWLIAAFVGSSLTVVPGLPSARGEAGGTPRTILIDLKALALAKQQWSEGHVHATNAVNRAISQANAKLDAGPYSVVFSANIAPSGDPHDFVSYGAYWWPNPDSPDGLPWYSRDGFINPDNLADGKGICDVKRATEPLSLAYYFTGDEKYAEKAASLIRTWFLDEDTYMNPRNEYAQIIPGKSPGSFDVPGFANCMPSIFDAAGILESSPAWSSDDKTRLQQWTTDLMQWAETSYQGGQQFQEPSNHGTNYDFLKALFGLYHEDLGQTRESLLHYATNRMPGQVASNGANPLEMKRADNLLYHRYNLGRAFDLASLARFTSDVDLFNYETDDGRGLRDQLDFLLPYMLGEEEWTFWPGDPFKTEPAVYFELLRKAAVYYQDPLLLDAADSLGYVTTNYINVTHPRELVEERLSGDFNVDGVLSDDDIDLMTQRFLTGKLFRRYDLNLDNELDLQDRRILVETRFHTQFGDADLDGQFGTRDIVTVFAAGEYNDGLSLNSTWLTGDWNGDGEFTDDDLVLAFQDGGYEQGPRQSVSAVPEPSAACLLALAATITVSTSRRKRS